uniref:beta-defensin 125-like n=1 Tax=Jaculus jaculus TaxID=51337 RepID=UPI001E1B3268|nr:beta-defensin 125-like [Jaculus jaculus]
MTLPTLTFIFCGLLTQMTEAGFRQECFMKKLGNWRLCCMDKDKYTVYCENEISCCIWETYVQLFHKPDPDATPPEFTDYPEVTTTESPQTPVP